MTLPSVAGWLIDFRTARSIFASGSNFKIDHCTERCSAGYLFISHCEKRDFKSIDALESAFLMNGDTVVVPDSDVMGRCPGIAACRPNGLKRAVGDDAALFLTAIAASRHFGVISDHVAGSFATVFELCLHYGIPVLRSDDYFAQIH